MAQSKSPQGSVEHASGSRRSQPLHSLLIQWAHELHRYAAVGGAVFLIDLATYSVLVKVMGSWYLYAHFMSRAVGGVACFLLNRFVTFKRRQFAGFFSDLFRFLILYGISFSLSSLLIVAAVDLVGLPEITGKVVAEVTVFLFNYTLMKYWVMKKRSSEDGLQKDLRVYTGLQ